MTKNIYKLIICIVAIFSMFCGSVTVFAEDETVDFTFNIQPELPSEQEETEEAEETTEKKQTEKETEKEDKKDSEKETEKETKKSEETTKKKTEKPTKKPSKKPAKTTERREEPVYNDTANDEPVRQEEENTTEESATEETTEETTEEETLPNGAFYVYLERNNGERRLKSVMKKPGYVTDPGIPIRVGYVFKGWYKDAEFKEEWNFYKDKATKSMTIYAKWAADESTVDYAITVKQSKGGKIEANPSKASMGEAVFVTVIPDEGKRLVAGSLTINGESSDVLSFVMPKGKVLITAEFEDIPEKVEVEEEKKTLTPFAIIIGILVVIILAIAIVIAKRRSDFNADLDPDEEDDVVDDETIWIDDTIVVEDGFKEGKKVVENAEPDYGEPDLEDEDILND